MSWLRNTSLSFARQLSRSLDPRHDYEPQACYNSFCKHWQQAYEIILKSQPQHLHDDVLGVVNHLEQLATLLVLEARARQFITNSHPAACLEHLLSENLLDKLYEWAICTGKYENAVRLEQLKLFGNLISHYGSQVIAAEPFLRPLLKLLSGFRNDLPPRNLESQLVAVLNQLCVVLMQNIKFVDLFFLMTNTQNGSQAEFIIGRLLLSTVHREGAAGSASRDALLLCAKMSARCPPLAHCMLAGNTCPVLATGLSGLYSLLPRTLNDKIDRLTPDDLKQMHKLTLFIDSLEFCNAVAQVAHPSIRKELLDLLHQGFLVPVMGPALLQSGASEQAAAMAYLELSLRSVTPGGLLRAMMHFLFTYEYDGVRVFDVLLPRLEGNSQLSLVTLSLIETLIDLNCEDVILELVYKYLLNGHHLIATYKHKVADPALYRDAAVAFLGLTPQCVTRPLEKTRAWVNELALTGKRVLDFRRDEENRRINGVHGDIPMSSLVQEVNFDYGNPNETLYGNYHAYLCDARFKIVSRTIACLNWTSKYDTVMSPKRENTNSAKDLKEIEGQTAGKEHDSIISVCTSGYDTLKTSGTPDKEPHSLTSSLEDTESPKNYQNVEQHNHNDHQNLHHNSESKDQDSLTSVGESSGYDSFRFKTEENEDREFFAEDLFRKSFTKERNIREHFDAEAASVRCWRVSAERIIGPLLSCLLRKAAALLESELVVNCRVTSILSKLISLPTPLLASLLVCPGFMLQPNVPSLYQILHKLKEEVDELTAGLENRDELVDKARVYLVQREMTLVRSRAQSNGDCPARVPETAAPRNDDSPFRRVEAKRRSLSSSFSNMFGRRQSSSPVQSPQSLDSNHHNTPTYKRHIFTQDAYWNQSITLRSIVNGIILDEWGKELASLCEEHALRLSSEYHEDRSYIRSVAL